ncbi:cytochrome P450 [Sporormia fimetaria CBS 119925]|uniref:Cytochrome P450 n=1 Tax=Sporormia fimetaria CBS 119925 TaxID=1340428 RepID=A0A6A6VNJ6_9PLEO|nr:cytochrome P450 [Sporormia fimetaria CBS 119925]
MAGFLTRNEVAVLSALATHALLNRFTLDRYSHLVLLAWIAAFGSVAAGEWRADAGFRKALQDTAKIACVYFVTLLTSVMVYRGLFHRLRKFPGPFLPRLSKWFSLSYVIPQFQYHKQVPLLHKQYNSDIVRTGPRELSIIDPAAIPLVHGAQAKCVKGVWYDMFKHMEGSSIHTARSKDLHREHRRVWDRAMNETSLRAYEPRVNNYVRLLISRLEEHENDKSIRMSDWVAFLAFDIMGDVGFSRSFGMLQKGKMDWVIDLLHGGMSAMSVFTHIPYVASLLTRLGAGGDVLRLMEWAHGTLDERKIKQEKQGEKDIVGHLLDCDNKEITSRRALNAAARLLVVAGSDTTSATLTFIFLELARNPHTQRHLRSILPSLSAKPHLEAQDLTHIPYLDAIINETMRLHPVVPSGVQRETPPEGLTLPNGTYIPGHTQIWMPIYAIHHDARNFSSPETFAPERWLVNGTTQAGVISATSSRENSPFDEKTVIVPSRSFSRSTTPSSTASTTPDNFLSETPPTDPTTTPSNPEGTTTYTANPRAFMPFSTGTYKCAGWRLAMIEMRCVVANIVRRWEVRFAVGEDGSDIDEKTQDCFTVNPGKLDVRLVPWDEDE